MSAAKGDPTVPLRAVLAALDLAPVPTLGHGLWLGAGDVPGSAVAVQLAGQGTAAWAMAYTRQGRVADRQQGVGAHALAKALRWHVAGAVPVVVG